MSLESTVFDITVNLGAPGVSRAGFGTGLILGDNAGFSERVRFYTSPADLLADGDASIGATDPEYLMAVVLEGNGLKRFAVGRQDAADSSDYGATLDAVVAESNDFFGVACISAAEADIDAIAAKCITHEKLFFARTADSDVITSATDDVASELKDAANEWVALNYHATAATVYPDAGLMAAMLRVDWDTQSTQPTAKQLQGVAKDSLTATARTYALAKNVTIYEDVKSLGWTYGGKVAAGYFIDEIIIREWFKLRLEEDLAQLLADVSARDSKVPGNARGAAMVEAVYRKRDQIAVQAGHCQAKRADGSPAFEFSWSHNASTRQMTVTSSSLLSGAVHSISSTTNLETE